MRKLLLSFFILSCIIIASANSVKAQANTEYDIVILGGRVIDPETKMDAIRNIGINKNQIKIITAQAIKGKQVINAKGLVVAPGFIDLHVHGRTNKEQEYQLHDGLTTALELEWGIENIKEWYATRKDKALINYGASVCWPYERFKAISKYESTVKSLLETTTKGESSLEALTKAITPSYTDTLTADESNKVLANIRTSLAEGGIGIGVPIGYLKYTTPAEMFSVYQLAGQMKALVYSHVREPNINAIQEAIADAVLTGAPLHIVHVNSMSLSQIQFALDMISSAKKKGFDISTELYPYTAGSTMLQSAMFTEGWQQRLGIQYKDLQWVATGERLTKETFDAYRQVGGTVILHVMKPEWIRTGIAAPGVMIASDGMPYAPLAHPRTAGTFTRVLGKYVREDKVLDLMTAIEKMTLLPAKRLETVSPMMHKKGRLQVGADADITIFNPNTVIDKATFETGLAFSQGVEYVIVNGTIVLKNGNIVASVFPGQAIWGKFKK